MTQQPEHQGDSVARVRIVHQIDPDALIPGGTPTFIRGIIKAAPSDIQLSVIGLTTDPVRRPVGCWTTLRSNGKNVEFFPVGKDSNPGGRSGLPLSVKLTVGVRRYWRGCAYGCDLFDFHRFEPVLPFLKDPRPKSAFVHQNMDVIRNAKADIMWKHLPSLYFALERRVIPQCSSIFCVRSDAVDAYRNHYPDLADRFRFIPTWVDPDVFFPADAAGRYRSQQIARARYGLLPEHEVLITVGRLDQQKNPMLLIDTFARITGERPKTRLLVVGDGILRRAVAQRAKVLGIASKIVFTGLQTAEEVACLMQVCRAFLLTSAYEGMPMSVLEALGCGVPVVTTRVGEVERVVHHGTNGRVVSEHVPDALARATLDLLSTHDEHREGACVVAVKAYSPTTVLAPVFDNYRQLVDQHRATRNA